MEQKRSLKRLGRVQSLRRAARAAEDSIGNPTMLEKVNETLGHLEVEKNRGLASSALNKFYEGFRSSPS